MIGRLYVLFSRAGVLTRSPAVDVIDALVLANRSRGAGVHSRVCSATREYAAAFPVIPPGFVAEYLRRPAAPSLCILEATEQ